MKEQPSAPGPPSPPTRWRWRTIFAVLGIAGFVTVPLPWIALIWSVKRGQAAGEAGTEYYGAVFAPLIRAGVATAAATALATAIYLARSRPTGLARALAALALLITVSYVGFLGVLAYPSVQYSREGNRTLSASEATALISDCRIVRIREMDRLVLYGDFPEAYFTRYADAGDLDVLSAAAEAASETCDQLWIETAGGEEIEIGEDPNVPVEISPQDAAELLRACRISKFHYTQQTGERGGGTNAESSSTGIVLAFRDNPIRLHIADRHIPELLPIARHAQETCRRDMQFWHDGGYESRDDEGNWMLPPSRGSTRRP